MSGKIKNSVINQIIIAVVVALLIGGTSPWWWKEVVHSKPVASGQDIREDIAGIWMTNVPNLVYSINQDGDQFTWKVINGDSGKGKIKGNHLYPVVNGREVHFYVSERAASGRPLQLKSDDPQFVNLELTR